MPNALPEGEGDGAQGLQQLGIAGEVAQLQLVARGVARGAGKPGARIEAPTSVSLFEQGLLQVLQASATGLEARKAYVLALAEHADGSGNLQALAAFTSNPAGAAIVNAIGPIRQIVRGAGAGERRYLVIAPQVDGKPGEPVQIQANSP